MGKFDRIVKKVHYNLTKPYWITPKKGGNIIIHRNSRLKPFFMGFQGN